MDKWVLDGRKKINRRMKCCVGGIANRYRQGWTDGGVGTMGCVGRHLADGFNRQEQAHQYISFSSSSSPEQRKRMASPGDTRARQQHGSAPCPSIGGLPGYHCSAGHLAGLSVCFL